MDFSGTTLVAGAGLLVGAVARETFRAVVDKLFSGGNNGKPRVMSMLEKQAGTLEQQTRILASLAATNEQIKDGIIELVTLAKFANGKRRP